jgi:hypothetical protein
MVPLSVYRCCEKAPEATRTRLTTNKILLPNINSENGFKDKFIPAR